MRLHGNATPCEGGCGWANRTLTLCTECAGLDRDVRTVRGRTHLVETLRIGHGAAVQLRLDRYAEVVDRAARDRHHREAARRLGVKTIEGALQRATPQQAHWTAAQKKAFRAEWRKRRRA